jgi:hypothetical protein
MRELRGSLPPQSFDSHDGQAREQENHDHLSEILDAGDERQPEDEKGRDNQVHQDRLFTQVGCQDAAS